MRKLTRNQSGRSARSESLRQQLSFYRIADRVGLWLDIQHANHKVSGSIPKQNYCQTLCIGASTKLLNCPDCPFRVHVQYLCVCFCVKGQHINVLTVQALYNVSIWSSHGNSSTTERTFLCLFLLCGLHFHYVYCPLLPHL